MTSKNDSVKVETRLPAPLRAQITQVVQEGYYLNDSELVRDAIRRLLCEEYAVSLRDNGVCGVGVGGLDVVEEQYGEETRFK